ncbi:hypothetical protein EDF56_104530 [Novosphingobium sp. PhB165]|nr:hypothetical protein EDF56_104530 [Novosphingobium sp. PhB165]
MGAGKWMVLLLVAGTGTGFVAGGMAAGGMRQLTERFAPHDNAAPQGYVAFNAGPDRSRSDSAMAERHVYNDQEGYPLEGNDGDEYAYAPQPDGPAFRAAPAPGQIVILRGDGWQGPDWQSDDGSDDSNYAQAAPRGRAYAPSPQYAPQYAPDRQMRAPAPAGPPVQDAASAAAARARAAADDVTAAEHGTS